MLKKKRQAANASDNNEKNSIKIDKFQLSPVPQKICPILGQAMEQSQLEILLYLLKHYKKLRILYIPRSTKLHRKMMR